MIKSIIEDVNYAFEKDPAAKSKLEVLLLYPHIKALILYRIAHKLYKRKFFFLARFVSNIARFRTGIEIHPNAQIGRGLFIDHGMSVVIGQTSIIGDNVTIYQGVTIGGTGKDKSKKRHPTIGNNVIIGANASILGNIIIADGTKIGAGAIVLSNTEVNSTVVGFKARKVK